MGKRFYYVYIVIAFFLLIIPFAGMTINVTNETTENTVLAEWPQIKNDGQWNVNYISQMGEYFEDHFAFRTAFVTVNALVREKLLTSSTEQVIVGTNECLYFGGTLEDYQGNNLYDERMLFSIINNLSLIQEYVESHGSRFVLMIPPNKNSLYGEDMPYYYVKGKDSNYKHIIERLNEAGISNIDLFELFSKKNDVFYYKRDSHWNIKGALLAYNSLMETIHKEHETWANVPASEKTHVGDIDAMLFPLATKPEKDISYDNSFTYYYVNEVEDDMDSWIETCNTEKSDSILMYRDSFGEALLPFLANEFKKGYFTQLLPYNLNQIESYNPDVLVIEKTERNLSYFIEEAPIMEPISVENIFAAEIRTETTLNVDEAGSYLFVHGTIDGQYLATDTRIFIAIRDTETNKTITYPAFLIESEEKSSAYQVYIKKASITNSSVHLSVMAKNSDFTWIIASTDYEE